MKGWQLVLAAVLYLWAAIDFARARQSEDAAAWLFYALANCAFAWKAIRG